MSNQNIGCSFKLILRVKGVAMIFCWGGPDFKLQTNDRYILQMYLVFNVFYFYSGVGQKGSGVGRAHLAPPFATPLLRVGVEESIVTTNNAKSEVRFKQLELIRDL
jgi:hypothetical protein